MDVFKEHARTYTLEGLSVFPCAAQGKIPLTRHGCRDGTTDETQVSEWCETFPNANIGLSCGESGLVGIDVDRNKGGLESLKVLMKDPVIGKALKETRSVKTGTGGYHFWFKARENVKIGNGVGKSDESPLGKGIDVRGDGGYLISPPSINSEGNPYVWYNPADPLELPLEIVAKLKVEKWSVPEKLTNDPVAEGGRNDYLMRAGCSMRAKGFVDDEIYAALIAMNAGRCSPPLDNAEVEQIVGSVCRYEVGTQLNDMYSKANERFQQYRNNGKKKFKLTKFDDIQAREVEWLMPGYIAKGKFNLGWGLEGRGKTYATIGITSKITNGLPLPGIELAMGLKPASVLLLTYEDDPEDTIKPRLMKCGADMSRVYTVHYQDGVVSARDMQMLEATIEDIPDLDLMVIDPLTAFASGIDDNNEIAVRDAMNPLVRLAMKRKFAILGIKHANKNSKAAIIDRVSGSRGWNALARSAFLVGHDNNKENGQFETYGGIVSTKGNLTGLFRPLTYEVIDGVFEFTGYDPNLTPDRLFPKKKEDEE